MSHPPRIGLIVPASNTLAEVQFQRYTPAGIGVHTARVRMTGEWQKPLRALEDDIAHAAATLSDVDPGVILFHCTSNSMSEGLAGEKYLLEVIEKASGRPALTTGQAITEAFTHLGMKKLVLVSPYVAETNAHETEFLHEAGFAVVHDHGLGLKGGGDAYASIPPERWTALTLEHQRAEADGYLLSCTATTMIEAIDDLERRLDKPVVTSNQAGLWAALRRMRLGQAIAGLGRLFRS